jgi:hypothetical protein
MQLRGVAQNRPKIGRRVGFNSYVLGKGLGGESFHLREQISRLQGHPLAFDSTGECQHLLDNGCPAPGA